MTRLHKSKLTTYKNGDESRSYYKKMVSTGGKLCWYLHRNGKPAIILDQVGELKYKISWYAYGVHCTKTKYYCDLMEYDEMKTMTWLLKYGDDLPSHI